jgi:hypothetical protein
VSRRLPWGHNGGKRYVSAFTPADAPYSPSKDTKILFKNDSVRNKWMGRAAVFQWWTSACGGAYLTITSESVIPLIEKLGMSSGILGAATIILMGVSALNSRQVTQLSLESSTSKKRTGKGKEVNEYINITTLGLMGHNKGISYHKSAIKRDLSQWRLDIDAPPSIRSIHIDGEKSFQLDLGTGDLKPGALQVIRRLVDPRFV